MEGATGHNTVLKSSLKHVIVQQFSSVSNEYY